MGYGSGMSNALQRFKKTLEETVYFRTKTRLIERDEDKSRSIPVEVEVPIVFEWEVDETREKGSIPFSDYKVRCRVLGTGEEVFHHFNLLAPLTPMEVIAHSARLP